jgi:hypothetical protein
MLEQNPWQRPAPQFIVFTVDRPRVMRLADRAGINLEIPWLGEALINDAENSYKARTFPLHFHSNLKLRELRFLCFDMRQPTGFYFCGFATRMTRVQGWRYDTN